LANARNGAAAKANGKTGKKTAAQLKGFKRFTILTNTVQSREGYAYGNNVACGARGGTYPMILVAKSILQSQQSCGYRHDVACWTHRASGMPAICSGATNVHLLVLECTESFIDFADISDERLAAL